MSSSSILEGLPLHILKQKAAVDQEPSSQSLVNWIQLAQRVYTSATAADSQNQPEKAYVHYFKAASVLQLILKHPDFTSLKTKHPTDFRLYLEVAPKILSSTNRVKQLAEMMEHRSTASTSSSSPPSAARARKIGSAISSRMKVFEPTPSNQSPSSSSIHRDHPSQNQHSSTSPVLGRNDPPIPSTNDLTVPTIPPSFVSAALEAESTIRSGSAPPELTIETLASTTNQNVKLKYNIGNGLPSTNSNVDSNHSTTSTSSLEHTLVQLRTPSQFDHIFPPLKTSDDESIQSLNRSRPLPALPNVSTTLPPKRSPTLPPPPQPFELPEQESDPDSILDCATSDHLVNDTSLGASLTNHTLHRSSSPVGAPPPYPSFDIHPSPLSPSREKSLISPSASFKSPGILKHCPSIEWTLSSSRNLTYNDNSSNPGGVDSLPTLPTDANEILPATLMDYFRKSAALGVDTKVLFLDVRTRHDFESCRIKSDAVVCIEPLILSKNGGRGVSSTEIEQSLILSPKREQTLFETRQTFDYVIIYDKRSTQLPVDRSKTLLHSSDPSEEAIRLLLLLFLAIHKEEYIKQLKRPPVLLSGGMEGWIKIAGKAGVVGRGFSTLPPNLTPPLSEVTSSLNGISITLRQPPNQDQNCVATEKHDDSSDLKRARRQVALFQRGGSVSNPNFIVRSVADLTRPNGTSHHPPESPSLSTFQAARPGLPPPYSSSSYSSNGITSSPITLPQQTLQRLKSSELYDVSHSSNESSSSVYTSTASSHMPPTLYHPHSHPPSSAPPIHYDTQQPLSLTPRPMDMRYGAFTSNSMRPAIQYPPLRTNPRPLQPPPAALTPGGSSVLPSHFNRSSAHTPFPPQSALLGEGLRPTPPITPFSPHRHGPSEIFFNPSFEDGQVGFTGLKNLGNTCYMNSTIQCLSATIPLARFFKDGSYKRCINRTNPFGTKGLLAESVAELVRVLWGAQYTFVSPITFRDAICAFAPQFRGSDQQDAQEFLGFLLDGLHEDLNLVTDKPAPIEMSPEREAALETLPTQIASAREWEIYKRRDNSVIVELFQGQYRSRLQCLTCNTTSTTYNTFMYLSLPIPTKRGISRVSLTQCLDAFLKEEIMEKDDAWNCSKCKTRRKATKRLSLARLPPILLIHLKRFSFKGPFSDKLETFVQYPLYGLDLSSYVPPPLPNIQNEAIPSSGYHPDCSSRLSHIYDLYAVCNHFGSLSSGHYTAFARSQKDWYNIGDSRVSKTDEKSVKARSAYLLCFRRRE